MLTRERRRSRRLQRKIERALEDHAFRWVYRRRTGLMRGCTCGFQSPPQPYAELGERRHLAEILAEQLADDKRR